MGSAVESLIAKLARVYVPPHVRVVDGKKIHVDGYTRDQNLGGHASWWEVARSFWEHSVDRPVKFQVSEPDDSYESVPGNPVDATAQAVEWDRQELRRRYDETNDIYDTLGYPAASKFDWEMADIIRYERKKQNPEDGKLRDEYVKEQQLKVIHGGDQDALDRQFAYVSARVSTMKIDQADPELVLKVRSAWDNVEDQPNMRNLFARYGDIPVYVATAWAEQGELKKSNFTSAQAAYHEHLGIVYYDHTKDGYETERPHSLSSSPDTGILNPDQTVLNGSRELILRHEYAHRVRQLEQDHETDWYRDKWIPAWQEYASQVPEEVRRGAGRTSIRYTPRGSISDYSYYNDSESFAEVFALVTDPKWKPEMVKNYNEKAQKLIAAVIALINQEDRPLITDMIRRKTSVSSVTNLAAKF